MANRHRSWRPAARVASLPHRNVAEAERFASAAAGTALVAWALQHRRQQKAWWAGPLGALLLYRGSTGHCPVYSAAGVNTAGDSDTRHALSGARGVHVDESIAVERPIDEVYRFWRRVENLPLVMSHLQSVTDIDGRRSHWVAKAPMGTTVEWDAEIINEVPDQVIGWRSLDGATVASAGSVNFDRIGDRATAVRVHLQYAPPAGRLGAWAAWLFGEEPSVQIREDLQRFKETMESGDGR